MVTSKGGTSAGMSHTACTASMWGFAEIVSFTTNVCQPRRADLKPSPREKVRQQHREFMELKRGKRKW